VKRRWDDGASLRTKRSLRRTGMMLKRHGPPLALQISFSRIRR
jgi:hypothetical protein